MYPDADPNLGCSTSASLCGGGWGVGWGGAPLALTVFAAADQVAHDRRPAAGAIVASVANELIQNMPLGPHKALTLCHM